MKRFNKFLLGEIGMDGKKVTNQDQEEEKKSLMKVDEEQSQTIKFQIEKEQRQ